MAKCKLCGKHVVSGSVVHDECLPRWIPVTERLPEDKAEVLVYDPKGCRNRLAYMDAGAWYIYGGLHDFGHITHWMPLPDAPKDGDT